VTDYGFACVVITLATLFLPTTIQRWRPAQAQARQERYEGCTWVLLSFYDIFWGTTTR